MDNRYVSILTRFCRGSSHDTDSSRYIKPTAIMNLLLEAVHGIHFKLKLTTNYATIKIDFTKHELVEKQSLLIEGKPFTKRT